MSPELTLVLQLLIGGVAIGGVYALIALGFVLIYKATNVLNLAQGEMLLLGAYVSYGLIAQIGLPVPVEVIPVLVWHDADDRNSDAGQAGAGLRSNQASFRLGRGCRRGHGGGGTDRCELERTLRLRYGFLDL